MSGISDKAIKSNYAENKYRGNGGVELQNKEFSDGSGLEAYDANFRMYDPQLGRFWQQDPLADANENWSPYSFANDNPVSFNDPLGLTDSIPGLKPYAPAPVITPLHVHTPDNQPPSLAFVGDPPGGVQLPPGIVDPGNPIITPGDAPTGQPVDDPLPPGSPVVSPLALGLTALFVGIPITGNTPWENGHELPQPWVTPEVFDPFKGHGNRKDNSNPHIVYAFGFKATDGKTPILKYGISDEYRFGMDRPESQLAGLRAKYGPTVMYSIYTRTISREMALFIEEQLVGEHKAMWNGALPREQIRPNP